MTVSLESKRSIFFPVWKEKTIEPLVISPSICSSRAIPHFMSLRVWICSSNPSLLRFLAFTCTDHLDFS